MFGSELKYLRIIERIKQDIHESFPQNPALIFHVIDQRNQGIVNYHNL